MPTNPRIFLRRLLALGMVLSSANAGTVTISNTMPAVNGADIANDSGGDDAGGDQGHVWGNRPHQGQSFTTGSETGGYLLKAVTLKNLNNNIGNSPTFNLRLGSLTTTGSPETFTQIGTTETASAPNYAPLDYLTFTFSTPLTLAPNKRYAFLWGSAGSGFVSVILRNVDRVFHLDIETLTPSGVAELGNLPATAVSVGGATLNGQVFDVGKGPPSVSIRWGEEDSGTDPDAWNHAEAIPGTQGVGSFSAATSAPLLPNTTYFFTAFATNTAGDSAASPSLSFTTPPAPPAAVNTGATNIAADSATLNAIVTDTGGAAPTMFIYWAPSTPGPMPEHGSSRFFSAHRKAQPPPASPT